MISCWFDIFTFIQVIKRYEKEFGSRNYQFTVGKVDFIAIDAQTLDGKEHLYLLTSRQSLYATIPTNTQNLMNMIAVGPYALAVWLCKLVLVNG